MWQMECISLCGIPCFCALSSSAIIEPSLHQLDLFLEIFYWDIHNIIYQTDYIIIQTHSVLLNMSTVSLTICIPESEGLTLVVMVEEMDKAIVIDDIVGIVTA